MKNKITKRNIYHVIMIFCLLAIIWGQILNNKVILNNRCLMPVYDSPNAEQSEKHFNYLDKFEIKYWYLSDIIGWKNNRVSIGDILTFFGFWMFLGHLIVWGIDLTKGDKHSH